MQPLLRAEGKDADAGKANVEPQGHATWTCRDKMINLHNFLLVCIIQLGMLAHWKHALVFNQK